MNFAKKKFFSVAPGAIALGAALLSHTAGADTHRIVIDNMKFSPEVVHAKRGDTLIWENRDLVPHTATSKSFDSGMISPGKSYKTRIKSKGMISYSCSYHPTMKATIDVKD